MGRKTPISFNLKNILKSIAAAHSECTAKHENTDYIVSDLIDFFGDD